MFNYSAEFIVDTVIHCYITRGRTFALGMIQMYFDDEKSWEEHQTTKYTGEKNMPIISFSDRDLNRGKIVEPAWYLVDIVSIGEAPSKDGGSTNYPVEGSIVKNADNGSEDFKGVPLDWNFNSKAIGFAVGFLAAFGVDVKAGARFDLNNAVGQQLEVFVENGEWQGRIVNRVNHKYRPARR